MLCVDLAMRMHSEEGQGLLPDYSALVIDEAHTFEEVAASHLGLRVTTYGIMLQFDRLYRSRSKRGLLAREEAADARAALIAAREITERFFARVRDWVEEQHENPLAYTTPGHIPNQADDALGTLIGALTDLHKTKGLPDDYRQEVKTITTRLSEYREGINTFLQMSRPDHVYWFELYGRQSRHISLNAVPIEVDRILNEVLFSKDFPVILTSATLAIRQDLTYFKQRLGAFDARTHILDSPFDFASQVELYVPFHSMPDPRDDGFLDAVCTQVEEFILKTSGKAFVLFTSYAQMNEVADRLTGFFTLNNIKLLVQGRELSRTQMLDLFRKDIDSVIFGTDSFWMGVDVPGEALSNVIIVKLPFPVPSHPLVAARKRRIEAEGGNAFFDYFVPEAILKFRQGIGRLIRGREYHGIIVILDCRIIRSSYGRFFLESIPDCTRHLF